MKPSPLRRIATLVIAAAVAGAAFAQTPSIVEVPVTAQQVSAHGWFF